MPKVIDDQHVYRAAIDVLLANGYERATTKAIATAAGINEATLFRKYGSKFKLIERAIQSQFADVPLAQVVYTGDLRADLLAIVEAYLETSALVGDILPTLLTQIPRSPELKASLQAPWANVGRISSILERYQSEGALRQGPVLASVNALLGPMMVNHMLLSADLDLPVPPIEAPVYVECFLGGYAA